MTSKVIVSRETPKDARHKRFTVRLKARGSDKEMGMSGRVPKHPKGKAKFSS